MGNYTNGVGGGGQYWPTRPTAPAPKAGVEDKKGSPSCSHTERREVRDGQSVRVITIKCEPPVVQAKPKVVKKAPHHHEAPRIEVPKEPNIPSDLLAGLDPDALKAAQDYDPNDNSIDPLTLVDTSVESNEPPLYTGPVHSAFDEFRPNNMNVGSYVIKERPIELKVDISPEVKVAATVGQTKSNVGQGVDQTAQAILDQFDGNMALKEQKEAEQIVAHNKAQTELTLKKRVRLMAKAYFEIQGMDVRIYNIALVEVNGELKIDDVTFYCENTDKHYSLKELQKHGKEDEMALRTKTRMYPPLEDAEKDLLDGFVNIVLPGV